MGDDELRGKCQRVCEACQGGREVDGEPCPQCKGDGVQPFILLRPETTICVYHAEPFREGWPTGFLLFGALGLQAVLAEPGVIAATGGDVRKVEGMLGRRALCCWLAPEKLAGLYHEVHEKLTGIGQALWGEVHCEKCDTERVIGGRFHTRNHWGRVKKATLCLGCVALSGREATRDN